MKYVNCSFFVLVFFACITAPFMIANVRSAQISNDVFAFERNCQGSSDFCTIDLSDLQKIGAVYLQHVSGRAANVEEDRTPYFASAPSLQTSDVHYLPYLKSTDDIGDQTDLVFSQSLNNIRWDASRFIVGESASAAVTGQVYGHVVLDNSSISTVPEPGCVSFLGSVALLFALRRRQRYFSQT